MKVGQVNLASFSHEIRYDFGWHGLIYNYTNPLNIKLCFHGAVSLPILTFCLTVMQYHRKLWKHAFIKTAACSAKFGGGESAIGKDY